MSPLDDSPLAASPGCLPRRIGKAASGGLRSTTRTQAARKACGTRASAPRGWEVRWGAALAQTNLACAETAEEMAPLTPLDNQGTVPVTDAMPPLPQTGTGQIWVDPALSQPNLMIAPAKALGRDVLGLVPGARYVGAYLSIKADPSLANKLFTGTSLAPGMGDAMSAGSIVGDLGELAGAFLTQYVLGPMVTNDNRGPQPFNTAGQYNPAFDEGAPF